MLNRMELKDDPCGTLHMMSLGTAVKGGSRVLRVCLGRKEAIHLRASSGMPIL